MWTDHKIRQLALAKSQDYQRKGALLGDAAANAWADVCMLVRDEQAAEIERLQQRVAALGTVEAWAKRAYGVMPNSAITDDAPPQVREAGNDDADA